VRVAVICAQPDDETLGCGGTMLKHVAGGDEVCWVIATQAHKPQWTAETIERKVREADAVASAYGLSRHVKLGFPSSRLDVTPRAELIEAVQRVMDELRPEVVYLVHPETSTTTIATYSKRRCPC
jgi:LmbE family N-acetylglucosaminyl deacetylase